VQDGAINVKGHQPEEADAGDSGDPSGIHKSAGTVTWQSGYMMLDVFASSSVEFEQGRNVGQEGGRFQRLDEVSETNT
jgi:hypothetical protein